MTLTQIWRRTPAVMMALLLVGCGSPVVNPGRTTTIPIAPPAAVPSAAPPSGLPTLETPEVPQVPAESVLDLPKDLKSATYHSVEPGETLTSIAKRYGLSVETLRKANGLDASAALKPQQLLYIRKDH